jgi:hypothetical protein
MFDIKTTKQTNPDALMSESKKKSTPFQLLALQLGIWNLELGTHTIGATQSSPPRRFPYPC